MSEEGKDPNKTDPIKTPEPTPKVGTKIEPDTKLIIPDDSIVVTKAEFANMQKTMIDLQKESDEAKKATVKAERDAVYNELLVLNPKLAKIHIESGKETLLGALSAAKEIKTGFQSLSTEKGKEPPKANESNHDSVKYDFVKKDWVYT